MNTPYTNTEEMRAHVSTLMGAVSANEIDPGKAKALLNEVSQSITAARAQIERASPHGRPTKEQK